MLLCLRPATAFTVEVQLWHDTTEARSGESQVESQALRAAVWHGKVSVRDGWSPEETWSLNQVSSVGFMV